MFCVTNNCGNANLLGVNPVRREVDHQQGSKGGLLQQWGLIFQLWGFWLLKPKKRNQDQDQRPCLSPVAYFFSKSGQTEPVLWMVQPPICWILRDHRIKTMRELRGIKFKILAVVANYSSCHCVNLRLRQILIPWDLFIKLLSNMCWLQPSALSDLTLGLDQNSRASCTNSYPAEWALTVVWSYWKDRMC